MKIAQDFSPGTAFHVNHLVPEARLSPCSIANLLASHAGFHTVSLVPGGGLDELPRRVRTCEKMVALRRVAAV